MKIISIVNVIRKDSVNYYFSFMKRRKISKNNKEMTKK